MREGQYGTKLVTRKGKSLYINDAFLVCLTDEVNHSCIARIGVANKP